MDNVLDILESLESDNSRNFKEDVLRQHRHVHLLKRIFVAAGDPYTNFYVNKFKMPQPLNPEDAMSDNHVIENFLDFVYADLSTRNKTGNAAKAAVDAEFRRMSQRQQKWCLRILLRNLRVGVMETTINKIWPESIKKFSVQLAETLSSTHEPGKGIIITDDVSYPVRVEPKLDGLRCIAIKHHGVVTMFTRSGSEIDTLPTIKAALEAASWDDFVLDGECIGRDWNESASVMMSKKNGKDDSGMKFHVFDAMTFDVWRDQNSEDDLVERVELVKELVAGVNNEHVVQVSGKTVKDHAELLSFYSDSMAKGYEGIMLKTLKSPYVFKRSTSVMKMKPVATYEGVVVGHYEGNRGSKREGLWGGFQVLMPNGVITKCGGGFNDKIRAEIGINPDAWIGQIVELEGQPDPLTSDGLTADGKVRFPVFVRVRDPRDVDPKVLEAHDRYRSSR